MKMTSWFYRNIICDHYWETADYVETEREAIAKSIQGDMINIWRCMKCGKRIIKPVNWFPINPIDYR